MATIQSDHPSRLDLDTVAGVQAYLADTPYASDNITPLSGGTANFAFRLRLKSPVEGHATLIFKHAKPFVMASGIKIPFDLSRQVGLV